MVPDKENRAARSAILSICGLLLPLTLALLLASGATAQVPPNPDPPPNPMGVVQRVEQMLEVTAPPPLDPGQTVQQLQNEAQANSPIQPGPVLQQLQNQVQVGPPTYQPGPVVQQLENQVQVGPPTYQPGPVVQHLMDSVQPAQPGPTPPPGHLLDMITTDATFQLTGTGGAAGSTLAAANGPGLGEDGQPEAIMPSLSMIQSGEPAVAGGVEAFDSSLLPEAHEANPVVKTHPGDANPPDMPPATLLPAISEPMPGPRPLSPVAGDVVTPTPASLLAGLAVAAFVISALLRWLFGMSLLSRIKRKDLLRNKRRALIYQAVTEAPGVHLNEIVRRSGLSPGQTQHHLRALVSGGLLVKTTARGYQLYFANGETPALQGATRALKTAKARRVLEEVRSAPGLTILQAAHRVPFSRAITYYHVRHMAQVGLISLQRKGRNTHMFPTQLTHDATAAWD